MSRPGLIHPPAGTWPVTGQVQVFEGLPVDTNFRIKEGDVSFTTYVLKRFDFTKKGKGVQHKL